MKCLLCDHIDILNDLELCGDCQDTFNQEVA